jgi:hypothetical protein
MATHRLTRMPLVTPLPNIASDVVFTLRRDIVQRITQLAVKPKQYNGPYIEEVTSTGPVTSSEALLRFSQKWWGQSKWSLGGFLGRHLFSLVDGHFGRLPVGSPKMSDYLAISRNGFMLNHTNKEGTLFP